MTDISRSNAGRGCRFALLACFAQDWITLASFGWKPLTPWRRLSVGAVVVPASSTGSKRLACLGERGPGSGPIGEAPRGWAGPRGWGAQATSGDQRPVCWGGRTRGIFRSITCLSRRYPCSCQERNRYVGLIRARGRFIFLAVANNPAPLWATPSPTCSLANHADLTPTCGTHMPPVPAVNFSPLAFGARGVLESLHEKHAPSLRLAPR